MLFNSLSYAIFLPIVFAIYWFIGRKNNLRLQNIFLLLCSYFFYASWDWRFLFLLIFSTALDYFSGIIIGRSESNKIRKLWLTISVGINLGFLAYFKYFNFFIDSFANLLQNLGFEAHYNTLNIILPIGISFYTFHGLSYVFDIYNRKTKPTYNAIDYALFVTYFPLLVAGPIERATHLLPQLKKPREFRYVQITDGLRQILWGLFKKIVIADNCAQYANIIFENPDAYSGSTLLLGAIFFTFQIYGDFSGYSDIALGSSRLLGIELLKNFNFPYFSRSIAEFWRRWHISLSSWFKDYLYFPLGGSRGGNWMRIRNTIIIFLVSGFWHGANWTFIVWGGLNALFILPSIIFKTNRKHLEIVAQGKLFPTFREILQMTVTFLATVFCWIFFRSPTIGYAVDYCKKIFSKDFFKPFFQYTELRDGVYILMIVCFFMLIEWIGRERNFAIEKMFFRSPSFIRISFYYLIIIMILIYSGREEAFIYFQF